MKKKGFSLITLIILTILAIYIEYKLEGHHDKNNVVSQRIEVPAPSNCEIDNQDQEETDEESDDGSEQQEPTTIQPTTATA